MSFYRNGSTAQDGAKTGILLVNLGTPEEASVPAVKKYLKEFLWDRRVVELPRVIWWLYLNGVVLNTRPRQSAEIYQKVWTQDGSPLKVITEKFTDKLRSVINERLGSKVVVQYAMRYGQPSVRKMMQEFHDQQVTRLLILPLYPQYSATTSASVTDAVFTELLHWRMVPELRTINSYATHPAYINAIAASIKQHWHDHGRAQRLLFSFHSIPQSYVNKGDIYQVECMNTVREVVDVLAISDSEWSVAFQSRLGRQKWVQPYTDKTLIKWAQQGLESVDVVCPGFSMDCLETLEEINQENREYFMDNGGSRYSYIPALNDSDDHVDCMVKIVEKHLLNWSC